MVLLYWSDMRAWGLQGTVDCNKKLTRHRRAFEAVKEIWLSVRPGVSGGCHVRPETPEMGRWRIAALSPSYRG